MTILEVCFIDLTLFFRSPFEGLFNITTPLDESGFELLLADSIHLIASFTDKPDRGDISIGDWAENSNITLYSGPIRWSEARKSRDLPVGMVFYHGNGMVKTWNWTNCAEPYCSAITDYGELINSF